MKKPHALSVNISEPCQQSWADMTTVANGRFCTHCAKEVVDFTNLSDAALLDYVQVNGFGCGRFEQQQLDRIIMPVETTKRKCWPQVMLSLGLLLGIQKLQAQTISKTTTEISAKTTADSILLATKGNVTGELLSISGTLTDGHGDPLVNAGVKVVDPSTGSLIGGCVTDFDGIYFIKPLEDRFFGTTIAISFLSAGKTETREVRLDRINNTVNCQMRIDVDRPALMALGGYGFRHYTRWQLMKRRVRRLFH